MNNKLEMVKGFLATQLNYIPAVFVVYIIYFGILKQEPVMWKYIVPAVLPFIFYCIRVYVKNMILFFILHIGVMILPQFLAGNIAEFVFLILFGIVFGAVSIYFKVAMQRIEDGILFPAMTCIIAIISYFVAVSFGGERKAGKIVLFSIIYIVYYIIHQYIQGYNDYIKNNEVSNQNIPKQHIFKTSLSALVGFLGLFVGFAVLLAKGNLLADLIYKIGDLIERFMIWLLGFAPKGMEQAGKVEDEAVHMEYLENMGENIEPVRRLSPEMVELINKIVTIGAYIIFGTFILLFTYALFKAVIEAFKVKRDENEEEVVLVKDKVTKVKRNKEISREKENYFAKDRKIRKMYEDLVWKTELKYKKDFMEKKTLAEQLKYRTPKEQCHNLRSPEIIRRMYEEARYSNREITKDDVRRMKELCLLEGKK